MHIPNCWWWPAVTAMVHWFRVWNSNKRRNWKRRSGFLPKRSIYCSKWRHSLSMRCVSPLKDSQGTKPYNICAYIGRYMQFRAGLMAITRRVLIVVVQCLPRGFVWTRNSVKTRSWTGNRDLHRFGWSGESWVSISPRLGMVSIIQLFYWVYGIRKQSVRGGIAKAI